MLVRAPGAPGATATRARETEEGTALTSRLIDALSIQDIDLVALDLRRAIEAMDRLAPVEQFLDIVASIERDKD